VALWPADVQVESPADASEELLAADTSFGSPGDAAEASGRARSAGLRLVRGRRAERPSEPEPAPEPPVEELPKPLPLRELVARDIEGRPIAGLKIVNRRPGGTCGGGRTHYEWTDADGRAEIAYPTARTVYLPGPGRTVELEAHVTEVTLDAGVSLVIRVVDAETGTPVTVRNASLACFPNGVRAPSTVLPLGTGSTLHAEGVARFGGDRVRFELRLPRKPPDGYVNVALHEAPAVISRFARELELTVPLRRETILRLHLRDPLGRAVGGARVRTLRIGSIDLPHRAGRSGGDGELVISRIPFIRGETLALRVEGEEPRRTGTVRVAPPRPGTLDVDVLLEPGAYRGPVGGVSCSGCPSGWAPPEVVGTPGDVRVSVRRRDGAAAAHTLVRLTALGSGRRHESRTDAAGEVVFRSLAPQDVSVEVLEPGFVRALVRSRIAGGSEVRIDLVEAEAAPRQVRVVDHEGRPVPFAAVRPSAPGGYAALEGGLQRLALYTDSAGTCRIPGVDGGALPLRIAFGSRELSLSLPAGMSDSTVSLPAPE
jgi:hypothetical protein